MTEFLPSFKFVPENVKELIIQYGAESLFYKDVPTEHRVYTLLKVLNISPSLKGYSYIKYILENYTTAECQYTIPSLTKTVFPKVAEVFSSTSHRIERSVRTGIEKCKDECDPMIFNYFFGNYKKVTCSKFLSQLVAFLKLINN
ncbi:MAG: hypothetical protein IJ094_06430 [Bacilli bacterium]|nr:hypothetical protein [Bacilli bacterium]